MKNVIVTPNYLNRSHPNRWMVKETIDASPKCFTSLILQGVEIIQGSKTGGTGFGCAVGIKAKKVKEGTLNLEGFTQLFFDKFSNFRLSNSVDEENLPTGEVVDISTYEVIVLLPDGSFYGK